MKVRNILCAVASCIALILMFASASSAQIPELPAIPDELAADVKTALQPHRQKLIDEETQLRSTGSAHNQKCKGVPVGSPEAAACGAGRDSLRTAALELLERKQQFIQAIDSLKQLNTQESTLSQAIRSATEQIRSIVDQVTSASDEQYQTLGDQLRNYMEELRKSRQRVKRIAACACVRG